MYTVLVILLVASAILLSLIFADMLTENKHHSGFVVVEFLLSGVVVSLTIAISSSFDNEVTRIQEKTIIEFVDGTLSYDTLAMDKNGKLLTIELKRNED